MKYTLRHLQVFLAVAKEQSVSRAAELLSMSQSATSASLQEFENRYDMQLFDRSAKRLRINNLGTSIRVKAEALMAHAQEFDRELNQNEEFGHLRVGSSYTIGNYLAVKYMATYMQQHLQAKVDIVVSKSPEVVDKVLNFEVDVGLIEAEMHHEDLHSQPWRADSMAVFCSPDHPLAAKKHLTDRDILSCHWILREPATAHRQAFDHSMQGLLADLNIRLELTHNEAIKNAVKSGLGVGCLSRIAVGDEIELGVLVELPLKDRSINRHFYIITHKQATSSKAVDWWIHLCMTSDV
jgi:DNA-binding transcriptional LysR family regulator